MIAVSGVTAMVRTPCHSVVLFYLPGQC